MEKNYLYDYIFTFFVNMRNYGYLRVSETFIMEVIFDKEYLQVMYETGQCSDKKHRYQPGIIRKYGDIINLMKRTRNVMGLCQYNSLRYEKLKGDKAGLSSVRVNDQYRVEFEERIKDGEVIATICNITDLSNHYK